MSLVLYVYFRAPLTASSTHIGTNDMSFGNYIGTNDADLFVAICRNAEPKMARNPAKW